MGSRSQSGAQELPGLLERGRELARIEGALAQAALGNGALLVLDGPAGIGKTRLLSAAAASARAGGVAVLSACGSEFERDFAFGIVRQLLEPVLTRTAASWRRSLLRGGAWQAVAALELLPGPADSTRGEDPGSTIDPMTKEGAAAIVHGLYWVVAALAESEPLLVCVDDAHWSDVPSRRFVDYLARRLEDLAVTVVLAQRSGEEAGGGVSGRAEPTAAPSTDVMTLRPLNLAACAELVRRGLGEVAEPVFCEACHVATAGNPFLLTELIAQLRSERGRADG